MTTAGLLLLAIAAFVVYVVLNMCVRSAVLSALRRHDKDKQTTITVAAVPQSPETRRPGSGPV